MIQNEELYLIPLSAKTEDILKERALGLLEWMYRNDEDIDMGNVAFTLAIGREHFNVRHFFVVNDKRDLIEKLKEFTEGDFRIEKPDAKINSLENHTFKEENSLELELNLAIQNQKCFSFREKMMLLELGKAYVEGVNIKWNQLYENAQLRRTPLPTYPFAREKVSTALMKNVVDTKDNFKNTYFTSEWVSSALDLSIAGFKRDQANTVLILNSGGNLFTALTKRLQVSGTHYISVGAGSEFRKIDDHSFLLNPTSLEHYETLLSELKGMSISSFKSICIEDHNGEDIALPVWGGQALFVFSKACMQNEEIKTQRLLYVYKETSVSAAIGSFCRTIHQEHPDYFYSTLGISFDSTENDLASIQIENEIYNFENYEVKYINGKRYVKRYTSVVPKMIHNPFRNEGTYLITGGLGGLGKILAKHLAEKYRAQLILLGRSALTPEKMDEVRKLRDLGSEVLYVQVDLCMEAEVATAIKEAKKKFGNIDGVFHASGIYRNGFILRKSIGDFEDVTAPKISGVLHLDKALKNEKLQFFMSFSSIAASFGKVGQSDYSYANGFLDSFSLCRQKLVDSGERYGTTVSVNWPFWEDGCMQISEAEKLEMKNNGGILPLRSEAGIEALMAALQGEYVQLMVLYGLEEQILNFVAQRSIIQAPHIITLKNDGENSIPVFSKNSNNQEENKSDSQELLLSTENWITKMIAEKTGFSEEKIHPEILFEEYGIDSIVINQFNATIEKKMPSLPKTLLFEYQNIRELSKYILEFHSERLIKVLQEENLLNPKKRNKINILNDELEPPMIENSVQNDVQDSNFIRRHTRDKVSNESSNEMEIAIIGMSGRYPQANNLEEFWQNLKSGRDCITEVPLSRWDAEKYYDSNPSKSSEGSIYCKWGGFIEDVDKFDPLFFNISPKEAEMMDPQERIFLETVWTLFEDAGYTKKDLNRYIKREMSPEVGVFVGSTTTSYNLLGNRTDEFNEVVVPSAMPWSIANRVSYIFNFSGPSMPVDTACSSSLTAIHLACEALRRKECLIAVAGGVNVYLEPSKYLKMCQLRMLSSDGKCRSFGVGAEGFVPGEGVGAILLKPLTKAIEDGDHIHGVIKSSSINHGGRTSGYTVPNLNAQAVLITDALKKSGVDPRTIGYIEAHGTGTALGDPIEFAGLTKAYREFTLDTEFCAVGSVKTNIGHLESAAGIAGVTKILLQMKNKLLVPSLHAETLNPNLDLNASPFYIQRQSEEWFSNESGHGAERHALPRRAAVSSFGAGGVNVHLILEEFVLQKKLQSQRAEKELIVISARNKEALKRYIKQWISFLNKPVGLVEGSNLVFTQENSSRLSNLRASIEENVLEKKWLSKQEIIHYQEGQSNLLKSVAIHLLYQLQKAGLFTDSSNSMSLNDIYASLGVLEDYKRLVYSLLEFLQEGLWIKKENSLYTTLTPELDFYLMEFQANDYMPHLSEFCEAYPELKGWAVLVHTCLSHLTGVLNGDLKYTDILFPNNSMEMVEQVYKGGKVTDYYNHLVAEAVKKIVQENQKTGSNRTLKILEIGAGTGGTSKFVMEMAKKHNLNIQYFYTDISVGFTQYGKLTYGSSIVPEVYYKTLNIEEEPSKQGFQPGSMDVIIATNAIHATKLIRNTLKNINSLLAPGGTFILNEVTKKLDYATLSFGLTSGWWLYDENDGRIPNSPLINEEGWAEILKSSGLEDFQSIGLPEPYLSLSDQHVMIVRKKGISANKLTWNPSQLKNIAYTLQMGREEMDERLAIIVSDVQELSDKLHMCLEENSTEESVFSGNVKEQGSLSKLFMNGKEGDEFLRILIREKGWDKLAQLWVSGVPINWSLLYSGDSRPEKVSIPTYPFEKKRYWLPENHITGVNKQSLRAVATREATTSPTLGNTVLYCNKWKPIMKIDEHYDGFTEGDLLIFSNSLEQSLEIKKRIRQSDQGARIIVVTPGSRYQRLDKYHFEINIEEERHYEQLYGDLKQDEIDLIYIMHLWSMNDTIERKRSYDVHQNVERGFYSNLWFLKQWSSDAKKNALKVIYVYPHSSQIDYPEYSAMRGFMQSLCVEQPLLSGSMIGISEDSFTDRFYDYLLGKLNKDRSVMEEEIIENGELYVKQWIEVERNELLAEENVSIRKHGNYLITGGAGKIGLYFAKRIAEAGAGHITLLGRSSLNEEQKNVIRKIAQENDCELQYEIVDVSSEGDITRAIKGMKENLGRINGVIHAAGMIEDQLISKKRKHQVENVIGAKVLGTIFLDEALKKEALDFFVLFSSLAAVLGNAGQVDYAFGNSFMDHFAHRRAHQVEIGERCGKSLSLQWPEWSDGGMRMNTEMAKWFKVTLGLHPMSNGNGWHIFNKMLASSYTEIAVFTGETAKIRKYMMKHRDENSVAIDLETSTKRETLLEVKKQISELVSSLLKIEEEVNPSYDFGYYGFDSNSFIRLSSLLSESYGLRILPALLYEYSSIDRMADYIIREGGQHVQPIVKDQTSRLTHVNKSEEDQHKSSYSLTPPQTENKSVKSEDIAIVGISGIFPESNDINQFWSSLIEGNDLISKIPGNRWDWDSYFENDPEKIEANCIEWGGFIKDEDKFDSLFFNISPREAEYMDPQQRIFLETVWKAIEDSGYRADELSGKRIGMFVGVSGSDYHDLIQKRGISSISHSATGTAQSILANRISFLLNFKGPSEPVDTACSSSLVAIKRAVDAIRYDGCEMAIAGAVNLLLDPDLYLSLNKAGMLSKDGKCKTFDKSANGYVRGEGAAALVLKPMTKAVADGDQVYAVIKGIQINHGGHAQSLTAPNPSAQAEVIELAWTEAGLDPSTASYIETHGTGTKLGDPIEISALKEAFQRLYRKWDKPFPGNVNCGLGSVKTNTGHLEAAAGIASIVKVIMSMKHKKIPANLHFKDKNPYIELEDSPFFIVSENTNWSTDVDDEGKELPLRAGISSFGFGGVNAHMVLESYPSQTASDHDSVRGAQVIVLSAKNKERLKQYAEHLNNFLEPEIDNERTLVDGFNLNIDEIVYKISDLIKVDASHIDVEENINLLGIDSLHFGLLLNDLNESYNMSWNSKQFVEFPSIKNLFEKICEQNEFKIAEAIEPENVPLTLESIAFTLQFGRTHMEERLAVIVNSIAELKSKLQDFLDGKAATNVYQGHVGKAAENSVIQSTQNKNNIRELTELQKLSQKWVVGETVNWDLLYEKNKRPSRISLPTYPFAKERHWILPSPIQKVSGRKFDSDDSHARRSIIFQKKWEESAHQQHRGTVTNPGEKDKSLILFNHETKQIAERIGLRRKAVMLEVQDSDMSTIEYSFSKISSQYAEFKELIDLSDLNPKNDSNCAMPIHKIAVLQQIVKKLMKKGGVALHLTNNLQSFELDANEIMLSGAHLAGLYKMLGSEYRKIHSKTIDVDRYSMDVDSLCEIIEQEVQFSDEFSEVCYRNKIRYIPQLKKIESKMPLDQIRFSEQEVYVVTGGTRGIGAEVAKFLVENGARKIVLMGITDIPQKAEWPALLECQDSSKRIEREKVRLLTYLEKREVEVWTYIGQLTDEVHLNQFFKDVRNKMGKVAGVVHCAGTRNDNHSAFINKSISDMQSVFEPKVEALNVLHSIFSNDDLNFFVLFSSISVSIPSLAAASSDYVIANNYMDHFAALQRNKGNGYYISLAWPSWKEVGMGEVKTSIYESSGLVSHTTLEGMSLFKQALLEIETDPLLLPCVVDENKLEIDKILHSNKTSKEIYNNEKKYFEGKENVSSEQTDKIQSIKNQLKKLFAEELRINQSQFDDDQNFSNYGVDSILLADLVKKAENTFSRNLDPSLFLQYPTFKELSAYLSEGSELKVKELSFDEKSSEDPRSDHLNKQQDNKIAVIGIGCQFPQSPDKDTFWKNILEGKDCITEVPRERWDTEALFSTRQQSGKSISKWGGFIEGIEYFDPAYFNIREELAPHIDPTIRKFLEVSDQALSDAGYESKDLADSRVGVYVGSRMSNTYSERIKNTLPDTIVGTGQNFIAAHIAHFFNFKGPNLVVDTACSSSLTSIHLACQGLLSDEADLAIAGGVDILLDEKPYIILSQGRALSPDGRCHTFDEKANGFVPGEGSGAVLLKPLKNAVIDGDHIYAVIDASALNNDGRTMGMTTPNPEAQILVIEEALKKGKVSPDTVSYIEAHGTGTMIGDPIELQALNRVFQKHTNRIQYCGVGSVKTNIGHLLSAAGIASFIKTVLCVHEGILAPTLHCQTPNPRFQFDQSPFYPVTEKQKWHGIEGKKRAGISSFGFGGTNVHIIVSDYHSTHSSERSSLYKKEFDRKKYWLEPISSADETKPDKIDGHSKHESLEFLRIVDEGNEEQGAR
ncbi:SDR family NAD(P)-dependent oxidoreductase [Saccharibacillus sacchari]|uniref:SDR family NAD(P)-dependent oxidoreductase n=1 Tax=Saccharibacillus sacchari TaxID=456493 RepID=A0ACC6PJN4_9BACL